MTIAQKEMPLAGTSGFGVARLNWLAAAAGFCILLVLPWIFASQPFVLRIFSQIFLTITIISGFYLILGLSKQFSLAQVAIYGIGAYTMALLTTSGGISFLPALVMSAFAGALVGALIAIPGARFRGPWLALVTFAFAEMVRILMARWKWITGGSAGFPGIPRPTIFGIQFSGEFEYYFLFLGVAVFACAFVLRIRHSPYGRIWLALGDNPDIVASAGINVFSQRILAFASGSFLAALAGAAFASYATFISPESFGFSHTIYHLTILVVGGLESFAGGVIAAVFFVFLHNQLMAFHPWDIIVDGLIIILFMNVLPNGLGSLPGIVREGLKSMREKAR